MPLFPPLNFADHHLIIVKTFNFYLAMKFIYKIFPLLLINIIAAAQSALPTFQWTKRAGEGEYDYGYGIASDSAGNVFVSGKYEMPANFSGTFVTCAGNHDIFVAKYGPAGDFKWVRTAGGVWGDYARAAACDKAGNVYITGEIEMTCDFGSGVKLDSHGNNDIFLAKYNTNGDLLWAKWLGGGPDSDRGYGITECNGSVYVTGNFQGACTFEGIPINSVGRYDILVAKYSSDGVFQWIRTAGGTGDDEGWAISHDQDGNVYETGYFNGTANFNGTSVRSNGGRDIFIAKYNPAGNLVWVRTAGGSSDDYGKGITIDNNNRIFITGGFRSSRAYFDSQRIRSSGGDDIFIASYTASGNFNWVKNAGGSSDDVGCAITTDAASTIYITGNYRGPANFGGTSLTGIDANEIFFASYDASGNFKWVLKAGGAADKSDSGGLVEAGRSICTDRSGNILASGDYRSASTFGNTELAPWDHTDIFITKIGITPPVSTVITAPINNTNFPSSTNITITADAFTTTGSITKVEFFRDTVKIGEDTTAPYSCTWMNVSAGNYALHTVAKNNSGQSAVSSIVTISIFPCSIPIITPLGPTVTCSDSVKLNTNTGTGFAYQWIKDAISISGAINSSYTTATSGDYQVRLTNGPCVTWSAPTRVKIQSGLKALITPGGPTTFCQGSNVTLYASTCSDYLYQWKKNGTDIPGATNAIYLASDSGSYQVKIIQGSAVAWSALTKITVNPCRSNDRNEVPSPTIHTSEKVLPNDAFTIHLYPNPSTGLFTFEICMEDISEETIDVKVLNSMGQSVYGKIFARMDNCVKENIELESGLASGIYFLRIKIGNKIETTKILLNR